VGFFVVGFGAALWVAAARVEAGVAVGATAGSEVVGAGLGEVVDGTTASGLFGVGAAPLTGLAGSSMKEPMIPAPPTHRTMTARMDRAMALLVLILRLRAGRVGCWAVGCCHGCRGSGAVTTTPWPRAFAYVDGPFVPGWAISGRLRQPGR
jgi:hypothetical protein